MRAGVRGPPIGQRVSLVLFVRARAFCWFVPRLCPYGAASQLSAGPNSWTHPLL